SRESSMVQQPRAPVRKDCGFAESARWTPVTSWPASAARAAATAESTPPDMAARTRRGRERCGVSVITPPGYGGAGTTAAGYPLKIAWGPEEHPRTGTGASGGGP